MSYSVVWSNQSIKFLNNIEPIISQRIIRIVKEFSENPRNHQFKKIKGEKSFRLRVGDYRIIFDFDKDKERIEILDIGHRKNVYKR
ncbi:MAG: type II toxin-antitoxin system RelE/ParE family toxin [archaeon]